MSMGAINGLSSPSHLQAQEGEDGPEEADGQCEHNNRHGQGNAATFHEGPGINCGHFPTLALLPDSKQRVRDFVRCQQPPGYHGRANSQPGGQNELHPVFH